MPKTSYANNIRVLRGVALVLIAFFISAISLTVWALRADAIRDADNDTGNIAAVLSGQIARSIQSVDLVLSDVRNQSTRGLQSEREIDQRIRSYDHYEFLKASLSRLSQADVVAIIGKDGRTANSTSQWPPTGTDVSDRDYFQHLKNIVTDGIYISNLVRNRVSGTRTIFFGRRINGPNNEFFGVVLIGLQLKYFEDIYKTITALRDQSFVLLHPDGTILIRYPDNVDRGNQKMPADSPWHDLVAAGGGNYRSPGYFDNDARYVSVQPLKEYPLVANVAVKETAALANWRNRASLIGIGSLLALLCLAFLLWLLGRQLKRLLASEAALDQREQSLAERSRDLERLFETSLDLILVTDRVGNLLRVSPVSLVILGYTPEEMLGRNAVDFVYPADLENVREEMKRARRGRHTRNFETRYLHKDDRSIILSWSGVWSEPDQRHFFTGRDVTGSKATEEKLKNLAHFDQLTGLANRVSLHNDLDEVLRSIAGAPIGPTSIAIFDLDGFKDVNDTLGHSLGDRLLQMVASRLMEREARNGRFYRLGGDEFVLVMPGSGDPREITQAVDSMLKRLAERFDINGHQLFIGASAGIAIAPTDGADVEEVMANADLALYDAKAAGGNTYRLFVPLLRAKAQARRGLDVELRRACANKEFELFFQPQVSADDERVVGAEALLRWRHPERGILAPGAFIDALSKSPVVLEVGRWILRSACERAAEWRAAGLPLQRIGVNLFPAQFHAETLVNDVEEALAFSGLEADALEIEITENIALGEHEDSRKALNSLRDKGVKLAFDDFGTGYASLSYLARYPLTRLKIDQSFVRKIDEKSTPEDTAIVRSIIVMAHNLGLEVIAEGVETATQAAFLRRQKCEELQGYLYSKPLCTADFEAYLRGNRAQARGSRVQAR